jgi:signal transduction histidine kinase
MRQSPLILIVDDNPTNVKVLFDVLEAEGCRTFIARSGEDALDKLEVFHPDLILLDVMMEGMDGFETCMRIKVNPATQTIPVIFMTALSDTSDKVKGFSCGAVDYIAKPFQQEEVLARVKLHLELYHLRQQLEQKVAARTQALTSALQEVQQAQQQLQNSQLKIIQSEKMSALGNLVAGVAHEINNPVGCIVGNVRFVEDAIDDLFSLIDLYQQQFTQPNELIDKQLKAIDLEYLRQDLPKLVRSMKDGGDRITSISKSLRTFSRADSDQKQSFKLQDGIDSTLLILRHRLKANEQRPEIEIITEYSDILLIDCFPGQLNQVFMNILANAIDALEESNQGRNFTEIEINPNQIWIKTIAEADQVKITIADNGNGISEEVRSRIFDHLFTTKEVGKGTGLGLAIAHQIIVEKHGGTIVVNSEIGKGTEFVISIPL